MTLVAAGLAFLAGCATNPVTGKRELSLVSESQEIELGRSTAREVEASIGVYPDSGVQRYVRAIGLRLAADSERPQLPWSFKVVDDAAVNAFALPGGFIYVTRGILVHFRDEAELATVLGHEIGHVTARHSVQAISRAQIAQLGLGIGSILSDEVRQVSGAAGAGLGLLFLKYGREAEDQADELGFRYALHDGYDVRAMSRVFQTLDRVSSRSEAGRLPQWLSSHPDPENRLGKNEARLAAAARDWNSLTVNRDAYARMIDGMVYGENPRHGYFEGARFQHPDLAFRVDFPAGWKTQNQPTAVVGVSPGNDAMFSLTLVRDAADPSAAWRAFAAREGMTAGASARGSINGLEAVWGTFDATDGQNRLRGEATFVGYDGRVYRLLGYGTPAGYGTHAAALSGAARSFARLTDRAALAKQPLRVRTIRLARDIAVEEFHRTQSAAIGLDQLLLLNGVDAGAILQGGSWAKRVE